MRYLPGGTPLVSAYTRSTGYDAESNAAVPPTWNPDIASLSTTTLPSGVRPLTGAVNPGRVSGTSYWYDRLRNVRSPPTASAEATAPTRIATCWRRGVAPIRNPVFKSWDVLPPFATATAITHAIEIARTRSSIAVQPSSRKMSEIAISEAMVIPETGLAELPICPQIRDDTVVKKKPNTMIMTAPSRLTPICGRNATTTASATDQK